MPMGGSTCTGKTARWRWWKRRPEAYREKGRFKPTDPPDRGASKAWAYPVVADGRLYIRDIGTLWCYDVKNQASALSPAAAGAK